MALRIHHLTDTHFPRPDSRLPAYVEGLRKGAFGPRPDFIFHTGDLVDGEGSPDVPTHLRCSIREQHARLKALMDPLGIPFQALCHTHDRRGDAEGRHGQAFREVWGQELMRVEPLPENLDAIFLSGSVTLPPYENGAPPPAWGFDVFDPHVLDTLRDLVETQCRPGSFRVLCTHLPVLLPGDSFAQPARYKEPPIGDEGRERILPVLEELEIRLVLGGHLHRAARHDAGRRAFIVGPSTLEPYGAYGEMVFEGGGFTYAVKGIPPVAGEVGCGGGHSAETPLNAKEKKA